MTTGSAAAGAPLTWLLAAGFTAALSAAITSCPWVWAKPTLWLRGELGGTAFWQTYAATRALYDLDPATPPWPAAPPADALRVVLLGNSRMWLPARGELVADALRRQAPARAVRVDDAAFFGSRPGDWEAASRHLAQARPSLVVLGLSGSDLVPTEWGALINPTGEIFETGWRDAALPADGAAATVSRWLKAVWPLWRWRLYVRERVKDALWPDPRAETAPAGFATPRAYFDYLHGRRGAEFAAAFEAWMRAPTLERYLDYLTMSAPLERLNEILPEPAALTPDSPGARLLDAMLARLAAEGIPALIVLMPENPMLAQDAGGRFHRPGFAAHAADVVRTVAARRGARVVDARDWMPAEAFADFNHVIPGVSGFHHRLAEEILRDPRL